MDENRLQTYILLHGAWHGSWCWQTITQKLQAQGHKVLAPDLPGHGNDPTPFSGINLTSYVDAIAKLIEAIPQKVILVGHSMAGIIISQLAENMPDRIQALNYVAAFIPKNQESLLQVAKKSRSEGIATEMLIDTSQNSIDLIRSPRLIDLFYNTCTEDDAQRSFNLLEKEPFQPFVDPLNLSQENFGSIPKSYILCSQDRVLSPEDQRRMAQAVKCTIIQLNCDHSPFFSAPDKLVAALTN